MRRDADGRYAFVGRSKDLIKVSGENVTAAEIEAKPMTRPGAAFAPVIGIADEDKGEVPIAFVEASQGINLDPDALHIWCKNTMASYKVPVAIHLVPAGAWPMTSSGKVAEHELVRRPQANS